MRCEEKMRSPQPLEAWRATFTIMTRHHCVALQAEQAGRVVRRGSCNAYLWHAKLKRSPLTL